MADSKIEQKIVLDTEQFSAGMKKVASDTKSATDDMNKSATGNAKVMSQNEEQIKKWGKSVSDELSKVGKQFTENLKTGAKAMALDTGRELLKKAAGDAVSMAMSFSKAFAEVRSRSNASTEDLDRWEKQVRQVSERVGANMDSMGESFKTMFSVVKDPEQITDILESIGKASAMGGGNASDISKLVANNLRDQGRDVNKANTDDFLHGADLLRRNGSGFDNIGDSMQAMGSISGDSLKMSGMSERDLAAAVAATSKVTSTDKAVSTVKELMNISNAGLMQGSVLSAITGAGSLTNAQGKFDLSNLNTEKARQTIAGYGKNHNERREVLKGMNTGLSDDALDTFLKMIEGNKEFSATLKKTNKDMQTFEESAAKGAENLETAYTKFDNMLINGVTDIFGGFRKPLQDLLSGHVGAAAGGIPGAVGKGLAGINDHKGLVVGALATTAIAGSLLKSLAPGVFGKALGGTADLAKGVGMGQALKAAGVTPVYVVNAGDIGKDQSTLASTVATMMGGKGTGGVVAGEASAAAGAVGKLGRFGKFAGKMGKVGGRLLGPGLILASQGLETYGEYGAAKTDHDKNLALAKGGAGAVGGLGGAWAGAAAGAAIGSVVPVLGTAIGGIVGGALGAWAGQAGAQKIVVEIDSKDAAFSGRPKNTDNARDGRTN